MPGKPITPEGIEKDLSYVINGTYVSEFLYRLKKPRPGLKVFEAGCGSAKLSLGYYLGGADVWAIDIDEGVLTYARELRSRLLKMYTPKAGHIEIEKGSIFDISEDYKPYYDLVFSEGTTHHWPREDPRREESVKQMEAVCKPNGLVVVIGSNAHCPEMMDYAAKIDHTYDGMPPKQTPLMRTELAGILALAGLQNIQVEPVGGSLRESKLIAGWGRKA